MRWGLLVAGLLSLCLQACGHAEPRATPDAPYEEGVRAKGGSASARIWVLINKGQFAEAEALIAESTVSGLVGKEQATRMLQRISQLSAKLGEIPARLQRARDFPSQLKDYTLFEIKSMLEKKDFSVATQAQLRMAQKLIEEQPRLMEKRGN